MKIEKEYYIILGWLLGVVTMLISAWLQEKKDKKKKEIDIISENLKFIFRTGDLYNNFRTDKISFEKMRADYPEKSNELERKMYENFDENLKNDFFPQLMFQSFQLKRLKDKTFWEDFDKITNNYEEFGKAIMVKESEENLSKLNSNINTLKKNYIDKCHIKIKI